jgi:biopolymer transport protein ExbD
MTPMIDVTFQLLIFFLVTFRFRETEGKIQSDLPQDSVQAMANDVEQVHILVLRTGDKVELQINKENYGQDFKAAEDRLRALKERFTRSNTPHIFILDASQDVAFQQVITAINTCIRAGIPDLSFAPPPLSTF